QRHHRSKDTMAIAIKFSKEKAERFIDALTNGKAIEPPDPRGWTVFDMLALAGACYFGAESNWPKMYAMYTNTAWAQIPRERQEASWETAERDFHAAIRWYSRMTMLVKDEKYDSEFEPEHTAVLINDGEETTVVPQDGFKTTG